MKWGTVYGGKRAAKAQLPTPHHGLKGCNVTYVLHRTTAEHKIEITSSIYNKFIGASSAKATKDTTAENETSTTS